VGGEGEGRLVTEYNLVNETAQHANLNIPEHMKNRIFFIVKTFRVNSNCFTT
jgi:hypothetical protein